MTLALPLRRSGGGLFAPAGWAGHFLTVYSSKVLACHQAAPRLHDLVVVIATLVATLAIVWHRVGAAVPGVGLKPMTRSIFYVGSALRSMASA